jgi:hypothetical protein
MTSTPRIGVPVLAVLALALVAACTTRPSQPAPTTTAPTAESVGAAITENELLRAPVPAACRHPAGSLVNGELPGIPEREGSMELAWLRQPARKADLLRFGDLNGDGATDAATVLSCNAGGVPWPDLLAFYSAGPILLGSVSLEEIIADGHKSGERATVHYLRLGDNAVEVAWTTENDDDPACCGTLDYVARFGWSQGRVAPSSVHAFTERLTVDAVLAALRRHDSAEAGKIATPRAVSDGVSLAAEYPKAFSLPAVCVGRNAVMSDEVPRQLYNLISPGFGPHAEDAHRLCYLDTKVDGGVGYVVLGLVRTDFRKWRLEWIQVI